MRTIECRKTSRLLIEFFLIDSARKTENQKTFGHYATHDVDLQHPARNLNREVKDVALAWK